MLTAVISDEFLSPVTTQLAPFQLLQTLSHLWLSVNSTFPEHYGHGDDLVPSGVSVSQTCCIGIPELSSVLVREPRPGRGEVRPGMICWILEHRGA